MEKTITIADLIETITLTQFCRENQPFDMSYLENEWRVSIGNGSKVLTHNEQLIVALLSALRKIEAQS